MAMTIEAAVRESIIYEPLLKPVYATHRSKPQNNIDNNYISSEHWLTKVDRAEYDDANRFRHVASSNQQQQVVPQVAAISSQHP